MSYSAGDADWGDGGGGPEADHGGPWPAFVDLFAATALVLLVFFVAIAFLYIRDTRDSSKAALLYKELGKLRGSGNRFKVSQQGVDVLLILEEGFSFAQDSSTLLDPARETLREVFHVLSEPGLKKLVRETEVLGHADRSGVRFKNWQLSAQRAVSVAQFLVDSLHINPCSIVAAGRGAYFPRDSTAKPYSLKPKERAAEFARDRRVEIVLHPSVPRDQSLGRSGCLPQG